MREQCYGFTTREKVCRNKTQAGTRFCGHCTGSDPSMHAEAYAKYSLLRIPQKEQQQLLKHKDRRIRFALVVNPETPGHLANVLAQDSDSSVRAYAIFRHFDKLSLATLQKLAHDSTSEIRGDLARVKQLPAEIQATLADDPDTEVRRALSWNKNLTLGAQIKLANDQDDDVRSDLASNSHIGTETVQRLLNDACTRVVALLTGSVASFDDAAIKQLAGHTDPVVRTALAARQDLSEPVARQLANDTDACVVGRLIWKTDNRNVRSVAIRQLSRMEASASVSYTLCDLWAWHSYNFVDDLSSADMMSMCQSMLSPKEVDSWRRIIKHPQTSDMAIAHLVKRKFLLDETLEDIVDRYDYDSNMLQLIADCSPERYAVLETVAACQATPSALLSRLAASRSPNVRSAVAGNECTPGDALRKLAKSTNTVTQNRLARNPNTPSNALHVLVCARKCSNNTMEHIVKHPNVSPETLDQLAHSGQDDTRYGYSVKSGVASHVNTLPSTLEYLAGCPIVDVRSHVAEHPSTSHNVLMLLAFDKSNHVAKTATERLRVAKQTD